MNKIPCGRVLSVSAEFQSSLDQRLPRVFGFAARDFFTKFFANFRALASVVLTFFMLMVPARAEWIELLSPFRPCQADCAVSIYGGQLVKTPMHDIFVTKHQMPWDWNWRSSYLVAAAASREVIRFDRFAAIETEVGVGKRLGFLHEGEVWGALYLRWKAFPWSDYLRTTVAVSTGLNYATDVPVFEKLRTRGQGAQLLHFLSPELTLGLPAYPDVDLILRFHHRSGGQLSIFNKVDGAAQYGTAGLRVRF